jgi:hypothetical protein
MIMTHYKTYKTYILTLCLAFGIAFQANAQNNTNSPYSKFGIGDLANTSYGRNTAIGGTGIGIRDQFFLNLKNPASLTAIDTLSFLFETGISGSFTSSATSNSTETFLNGNLTHLAFGHRITPWLMGRATVMPYSNMGYNIVTTKSMEGEQKPVQTTWSGKGGLFLASYSLGIKPWKYLSLGFDAGYIGGPLQETRTTLAIVGNPTYYYYDLNYNGFMFNTGAQIFAPLNKKGSNLVVGATFKPEMKLTGSGTIEIKQAYQSNSTFIDTIYDAKLRIPSLYTPMSYGAGFGLMLNAKYLIAADYETSLWSQSNSGEYVDQNIYSLGFERLPQANLKFFSRCAYRVGFRYDSGYISAKRNVIDDMRLTVGMGFPIRKSRSFLNVGLEAGERGTISNGLIRERYTKLTVSMSMHDYWFVKRKFN